MANPVTEFYAYKQISASANVCPNRGILGGIFVSSGTPSITVYDSATTTTTKLIANAFTAAAGTYYPLPFAFDKGCYVALSGAGEVTVGFNPH